MSHRQKGEHKSRHRTHSIKPASMIHAPLAPLEALVPEVTTRKTRVKRIDASKQG